MMNGNVTESTHFVDRFRAWASVVTSSPSPTQFPFRVVVCGVIVITE